MLGPLPPSLTAPSYWYAEEAVPKRKPFGNWLLATSHDFVSARNAVNESNNAMTSRDMAVLL